MTSLFARPKPTPTLLLASLAGLGEFSATAYLPAMSQIASSFDASVGVVQASVTVGLLAFAVSNLVLGPLSDRMGRRSVLQPALVLYLLGCVLAVLAPSVHWLYVARVLTAVGACAGLVVGRAIARDLCEGAELTRLMATVTLAFSLAPALAPLLGGLLTDWLGWRSIFALAFLYAAVLLALVCRLPESLQQKSPPFSGTAVGAGYYRMLLQPGVAPALFSAALLLAALFCFLVGAPPIFNSVLKVSPAVYGSFPLIAMSGFILGTMLCRHVARHLGHFRQMQLGAIVALCGAVLLSCVPFKTGAVLGAMAVFNAGLGLALPAASAAVMQAFPDRAGQAAALMGFVQILGGALGSGFVSAWGNQWDQLVPLAMVVFATLACLLLAVCGEGHRRPASRLS